jgi:hypothetical protein
MFDCSQLSIVIRYESQDKREGCELQCEICCQSLSDDRVSFLVVSFRFPSAFIREYDWKSGKRAEQTGEEKTLGRKQLRSISSFETSPSANSWTACRAIPWRHRWMTTYLLLQHWVNILTRLPHSFLNSWRQWSITLTCPVKVVLFFNFHLECLFYR